MKHLMRALRELVDVGDSTMDERLKAMAPKPPEAESEDVAEESQSSESELTPEMLERLKGLLAQEG